MYRSLYNMMEVMKLSITEVMLILIITLTVWYMMTIYRYYKSLPPGPWGVPLFGYLPFMNRGPPHSLYVELSEKYGDVFSVQMGSNLTVCIGSAKLLKELFNRSDSTGRPHTPLNNLLGGLGIIQSEGALWKKQRQFLNDKFRALGVKLWPNARFEKFVIMELEELIMNLDKSNGQPLDPVVDIGRHMHNIICQLMMSFRFEENDEEFTTFNERVTRGMKLYGSVHIGEHVKHYLKLPGKQAVLKEIKRNLTDISSFHLKRLVDRSKQRKSADNQEPADLLDHYLDNIEVERNSNDAMTIFPNVTPNSQIVQVMNDLFSAGMETSRTTLTWCLVMMLREPAAAAKVREQLRQVLPAGQLVTLEHRNMLPYINAVIFETLRLASIVPLGTTHVNTRAWQINGYTIPAGSHIIPLLNKMNVDPELYPEPEKFKPERFIRNGQFHVTDNFVPFGIGQRMCLGALLARMELFIFFANIMNTFEFSLPENEKVPSLEGVLGVTHCPLPFTVSFKRLEC